MVTTYDRSRDPRLRAGAPNTPTTPSPRAGVAEYSTQRGQHATTSSHNGEAEQPTQRDHSAQAPRRVASDSQSGIVKSLKSHDIDQDVATEAPQSSASNPDAMTEAQPSLHEEYHMDVASNADGDQLAQQKSEHEQSIKAAWKNAGKPTCTLPFDDGELCGGYHPEQLQDAAKAEISRKTRESVKVLQQIAPQRLRAPPTADEQAAAKQQKLRQRRDRRDEKGARQQDEDEPTASHRARPVPTVENPWCPNCGKRHIGKACKQCSQCKDFHSPNQPCPTRKKSYAQLAQRPPPQPAHGTIMSRDEALTLLGNNLRTETDQNAPGPCEH